MNDNDVDPPRDREEIAKGFKKRIRDSWIMNRARGAECHHHLIEAHDCFDAELYIASYLCSITFIEISARYLKSIIDTRNNERHITIKNHETLNRKLLLDLKKEGVKVEVLAIEEEKLFKKRLHNNTEKVEVSKIRNNICHGNFSNYFKEEGNTLTFHPSMIKPHSSNLIDISEKWLDEFSRFKKEKFGI